MKANACKHKAMSYDYMARLVPKLEEEVAKLLDEAEHEDKTDEAAKLDSNHGRNIPCELARRETRLAKLRIAMAELEAEAVAIAEEEAREVHARLDERARIEAQTGRKLG